MSTDVSLGDASNISNSFPTITFCLNSMHSATKVKAYHPADTEFLSSLGFLYGYYYDTHTHSLSNVIKEIREHGKIQRKISRKKKQILSWLIWCQWGLSKNISSFQVREYWHTGIQVHTQLNTNRHSIIQLIACSFLNQPCAAHVEYGKLNLYPS